MLKQNKCVCLELQSLFFLRSFFLQVSLIHWQFTHPQVGRRGGRQTAQQKSNPSPRQSPLGCLLPRPSRQLRLHGAVCGSQVIAVCPGQDRKQYVELILFSACCGWDSVDIGGGLMTCSILTLILCKRLEPPLISKYITRKTESLKYVQTSIETQYVR